VVRFSEPLSLIARLASKRKMQPARVRLAASALRADKDR
jgi:hypothetical protein